MFYISPEGLDIEDNGVRETNPKYRNEIDETIQKLLSKHRPVFYTINGTTEERTNQVLKTIKY